MAKKARQMDIEEAIAAKKLYEHQDVFTGEIFYSAAQDHYEKVDPKPFAPPVDLPRPSLRQRIENLISRGADPLAQYVHDGSEDTDYEIPDDPDAPLTPSEANYIDMVASDLAERAPMPDDGMPRQHSGEAPANQQQTEGEGGEGSGGGSPESPPAPPKPPVSGKKPPKS